MRELKFRAWHKPTQLMDDVVLIDFYNEKIGILYADPVMQCESIQKYDFNEVDIMQSTGLKDKNDVEIFEGDIVIDRYRNCYTPIYQNGIYMAYNPNKLHKDLVVTQFNIIVREGCEVIGNIFEDGDLIDG